MRRNFFTITKITSRGYIYIFKIKTSPKSSLCILPVPATYNPTHKFFSIMQYKGKNINKQIAHNPDACRGQQKGKKMSVQNVVL